MSESRFSEAMEKGLSAHQAGHFDEALDCYRAALSLAPDDAEALSLCGLAMLHRGETEQALPALARAVELEPGQPGFRLNFAEGLVQAGRKEQAVQELRTVITAHPGNPQAWHRLHAINSEALIARRDWPALVATASAWTHTHPASHEAWRVAARAAFELGRHIDACNAFARALSLVRPSAVDLSAYASLCLHALNIEAATTALDQAEALDPDDAQMLATRALLLMYLGRFEEAESYCRRCLAREPDDAPAYTTLSRLRRGNLADADLFAVTEIMQRQDIPLDYRISTTFAVAHAHDARGDIDTAFATYEHAHSLAMERDLQENRSYDPAQVGKRVDRIMEVSAALPDEVAPLAGAPRVIFVVGMPRSGTTLLESVLAAHSRVFACGERPTMQQILRALLSLDESGRRPDVQMLQQWAAAYFRDLPERGSADHVTDKHPLNVEAAGLIARLLPDAMIIHVRRDPLETGLSMYRQEFNKHWTFAHRLADIGHHYAQYARLVAHWERTLPGRFTTIQYEDFVANFERAAPQLVAACGLEWQAQCLEFQRTPRAIATFSTVQARDPVRLGNGRAKLYAKYLGPLVSTLDNAGVDLQTGATTASS